MSKNKIWQMSSAIRDAGRGFYQHTAFNIFVDNIGDIINNKVEDNDIRMLKVELKFKELESSLLQKLMSIEESLND